MNTIFKSKTHSIKTSGANPEAHKVYVERTWRDSELTRTDTMLQSDRPDYEQILTYREKLREYPNQEGFPYNERPVQNV